MPGRLGLRPCRVRVLRPGGSGGPGWPHENDGPAPAMWQGRMFPSRGETFFSRFVQRPASSCRSHEARRQIDRISHSLLPLQRVDTSVSPSHILLVHHEGWEFLRNFLTALVQRGLDRKHHVRYSQVVPCLFCCEALGLQLAFYHLHLATSPRLKILLLTFRCSHR